MDSRQALSEHSWEVNETLLPRHTQILNSLKTKGGELSPIKRRYTTKAQEMILLLDL